VEKDKIKSVKKMLLPIIRTGVIFKNLKRTLAVPCLQFCIGYSD